MICQGDSEPFIKTIFTLKDCASIVGAEVISYDSERDMLNVSLFIHLENLEIF